MGAWDGGAFDNDDGADWGNELAAAGTPSTVRDALVKAADCTADQYLDFPEGPDAVAAAEVVAAAAGRPGKVDAYSQGALEWAARHPEVGAPEYVALALAALDRVQAPESELSALWLEAEQASAEEGGVWKRALEELRARLRSV
jgi:hypothetical protein